MKDYAMKKMQQPVEDVQDLLLGIEKSIVDLEVALARLSKMAPDCKWATKAAKAMAQAAEAKACILHLHSDALCGLAELDPELGDITVQRR